MLKPQGYAVITDPTKGTAKESDTITCYHCQRIVMVPAQETGFCRVCMHHLCISCTNKGRCTPFLRKIEKQEARARLRKSVG